jgi:septal ring factor EnvC (AmiA/AmiB activator)
VNECETELARLKNLLREMAEKRDSMPSEREEIKDRIIMKLEDELICTKIDLKEANLQIHKLTRMQ